MNELETIISKMEFLKSRLWYAKSANEVIELYIEYLKLDVMIHGMIPSYKKEKRDGNCYTYAMDFYYPEEFRTTYQKFGLSSMDFETGFISNRKEMYTKSPKKVIDNFYSDCEALKISTYDISIDDIPNHGGYKVLFYTKEYPSACDIHFIRQNCDGRWSHKNGRFGEIEELENISHGDYKLVRTLEIIKPAIR